MGLHFGGFIVWRGVLVAREPASRSVNKTSLSASRNADRLRNGLLRSVGACCLRVARPSPAAAHGCRSQAQVLWLAYGSARQAARSSETAIAFACACMRGIETAITFTGEKRAFLVQFPGAKVSLVSMVAVWGRAVVPAVSCWPASVAAEASLVSKLARGRVLCAQKFALLGLVWVRARKSSPSARKMAQISVFWRAGRVFRGKAAGGGVLGEFFRGNAAGGGVLGEFFRGKADGGGVLGCDSGAGPRRIPPRITSGRVTRGRGYCPG